MVDKKEIKAPTVEYRCVSATGGEICEGDEDLHYPNHETRYEENRVMAVFAPGREGSELYSEIPEHYDPDIQSGDTVFLTVVTYSTGNTFGREEGKICFPGLYLQEADAEAEASAIRSDKYRGYCGWTGYFESLTSVEVQSHVVQ